MGVMLRCWLDNIFFYCFTSRFDDEYNMKSIFRSQFLKMGEDDGEEKEPCCPLRLRTGGKLSRITRSLDLNSTFYSPLFFHLTRSSAYRDGACHHLRGSSRCLLCKTGRAHQRKVSADIRGEIMTVEELHVDFLFYFTAIHCQSVIFRRKYQEGVSLQWLAS